MGFMAADRAPSPGGLRWSVRTRILAAMLLVAAIGMTAAGATAYLVQRERIVHEIDERLLRSVESVRGVAVGPEPESEDTENTENTESTEYTESTEDAPGENPPSGAEVPSAEVPASPGYENAEAVLQAVMSRVLPGGNESSLGIIDGRPRFITVAEVDFHLEDDPGFITRVTEEVSDGTVRMGTYVGDLGRLRYIAVPVSVEGKSEQGIFVTAIDVNAELGEITTAFRTYAWVAAVSLIAVGLVGWYVAGRLLRPIRALRDTASRITGSDLSERIPVTGNDDVSALTTTVNEMLQRIDDSLRSQRQLLDDVRHELKTPLTIVRGHLELLDTGSAADVDETRKLVIDELDRMAVLVEDISLLATSQDQQLIRTEVDAAELTRQIFQKASAIAGHEWVLDLTDNIESGPVSLDADRITQAVLQLADNAAKYTPAGSPITIGCSSSSTEVHFWVADRGPGIPPESQARIFERFGRADTGRGVQGSGLGLPIVNTIAAAHGGRVTLTSSSRGSRFTIEIPTTPAEEPHEQHSHR